GGVRHEVEVDAVLLAEDAGVGGAGGGLDGVEGLAAQLGELAVAEREAPAGGEPAEQRQEPADLGGALAADDADDARAEERQAEEVVDEREVPAPAALALAVDALAGDLGGDDLVGGPSGR